MTSTLVSRLEQNTRRALRPPVSPQPPPAASISPRTRVARATGIAALGILLAFLPSGLAWAGPAFAVDYGLVIAMAVLSISVLGWIGEISLAPVAQMGFGVVAVNWCQNHDVPFGFILPLVALSSIPISLLLAAFTLRLKGVSFAIATLAFAHMAQKTIFQTHLGTYGAFGGSGSNSVVRPSFVATDRAFYYLLLASLLCMMAICYAVNRSRIGVRLTALRESEMAFSVLGHPPAAYRLFTICLSGAIATVAGAYFVFLQGLVPSYYFAPGLAVLYFGFAVAGGLGSIGGAVAAGGVFGALPRYFETLSEGRFVAYDQFFIGLVVFAVMLWLPGGLGGMARRAWHRVEGTPR